MVDDWMKIATICIWETSEQNQVYIGYNYLDHFLGQVSHTPKPLTCELWCPVNFIIRFIGAVIEGLLKSSTHQKADSFEQFSARRYKKVGGFLLSWSKKFK